MKVADSDDCTSLLKHYYLSQPNSSLLLVICFYSCNLILQTCVFVTTSSEHSLLTFSSKGGLPEWNPLLDYLLAPRLAHMPRVEVACTANN
jgi:hypothetical protein